MLRGNQKTMADPNETKNAKWKDKGLTFHESTSLRKPNLYLHPPGVQCRSICSHPVNDKVASIHELDDYWHYVKDNIVSPAASIDPLRPSCSFTTPNNLHHLLFKTKSFIITVLL